MSNRYLTDILKTKPRTITRVELWDIYKTQPRGENIRLKLGRYKRIASSPDPLEVENPRSELTLDSEEFQNLLHFLWDNYEPFKKGFNKVIPVDGKFNPDSIHHLKAIVESPEKQKALDFIASNDLLADELMAGLQYRARANAVKDFESMLRQDLVEHNWQKWFEQNNWVLETEFVRILDERRIDIANIPDYLMETYDGFLGVVEIKRPAGNLNFWAAAQDHENYIPSPALTKAITQATNYIFELEREVDSSKFLESVDHVKPIKPRCILVFGRSNDWNNDQRVAYRILNSNYHNLTVLTYDHVLDRAKRIAGMNEPKETDDNQINESDDDDIPF